MTYPVLFRFIDNPSYFDHKQFGRFWMKKRNYEERWANFKKQYNTFKTEYYIEDESSYYVKMEVPSNRRGNTYDVVIHFFTSDKLTMSDYSLRNYNIEIFSNNPVFGFVFGYANNKAGIVIPFLAHKLGEDILKGRPIHTNPSEAVGFDHSFYIAGKWLLDSARLLNKSYIKEHAHSFKEKEMVGLVRSLAEVMADYADNADTNANRRKFNKDKSLGEKAKEIVDNATSKVGELIDRTFKQDKKVKPAKHVGGKTTVITHKSATKSTITGAKKSAIKSANRVKPKRKI